MQRSNSFAPKPPARQNSKRFAATQNAAHYGAAASPPSLGSLPPINFAATFPPVAPNGLHQPKPQASVPDAVWADQAKLKLPPAKRGAQKWNATGQPERHAAYYTPREDEVTALLEREAWNRASIHVEYTTVTGQIYSLLAPRLVQITEAALRQSLTKVEATVRICTEESTLRNVLTQLENKRRVDLLRARIDDVREIRQHHESLSNAFSPKNTAENAELQDRGDDELRRFALETAEAIDAALKSGIDNAGEEDWSEVVEGLPEQRNPVTPPKQPRGVPIDQWATVAPKAQAPPSGLVPTPPGSAPRALQPTSKYQRMGLAAPALYRSPTPEKSRPNIARSAPPALKQGQKWSGKDGAEWVWRAVVNLQRWWRRVLMINWETHHRAAIERAEWAEAALVGQWEAEEWEPFHDEWENNLVLPIQRAWRMHRARSEYRTRAEVLGRDVPPPRLPPRTNAYKPRNAGIGSRSGILRVPAVNDYRPSSVPTMGTVLAFATAPVGSFVPLYVSAQPPNSVVQGAFTAEYAVDDSLPETDFYFAAYTADDILENPYEAQALQDPDPYSMSSQVLELFDQPETNVTQPPANIYETSSSLPRSESNRKASTNRRPTVNKPAEVPKPVEQPKKATAKPAPKKASAKKKSVVEVKKPDATPQPEPQPVDTTPERKEEPVAENTEAIESEVVETPAEEEQERRESPEVVAHSESEELTQSVVDMQFTFGHPPPETNGEDSPEPQRSPSPMNPNSSEPAPAAKEPSPSPSPSVPLPDGSQMAVAEKRKKKISFSVQPLDGAEQTSEKSPTPEGDQGEAVAPVTEEPQLTEQNTLLPPPPVTIDPATPTSNHVATKRRKKQSSSDEFPAEDAVQL